MSCFLRLKRWPLCPQLTRCLPLWPASTSNSASTSLSTSASASSSATVSAPEMLEVSSWRQLHLSVSKHACDMTQRHMTSVKHTPEGPEGQRATGRRGEERTRARRRRQRDETKSERVTKKKNKSLHISVCCWRSRHSEGVGRENVPSLLLLLFLSSLLLFLLLADHDGDRFKNPWKIPFLAPPPPPLRLHAARSALPWQ